MGLTKKFPIPHNLEYRSQIPYTSSQNTILGLFLCFLVCVSLFFVISYFIPFKFKICSQNFWGCWGGQRFNCKESRLNHLISISFTVKLPCYCQMPLLSEENRADNKRFFQIIDRNQLTLVRKLHVSGKTLTSILKHFIVLLASKVGACL